MDQCCTHIKNPPIKTINCYKTIPYCTRPNSKGHIFKAIVHASTPRYKNLKADENLWVTNCDLNMVTESYRGVLNMSATLVHILHKYECNTRIHTNTYMSATGFQSWHKYECNTLKIFPDPPHSGVAIIYGPLVKWLKTILWVLHSYLSHLKKCCTHIPNPPIVWFRCHGRYNQVVGQDLKVPNNDCYI